MSNVISFLEKMGSDARLRHASPQEVAHALESERVDVEERAAIIAGNPQALETLLGSGIHCCLLFPEKEDEDDDREETPAREGEETAMLAATAGAVAAA